MEVVHRVANGVCSISRVCRPSRKLATIEETELKVLLNVEYVSPPDEEDSELSDNLSRIVLTKKFHLPPTEKIQGICLPLLGIAVIILCVSVGFLIGWLVAIFETRKIIAVVRRINRKAIVIK
ncbi:hypothetical protein M514_05358 [Trichuris suis]|uniref:Uncharacterized protein n=1 Tax=Trichuris suis TaxID=68888 RepID=A0A085NQA0_9BILA|nr:hypothetical protein M513_05358 [Trichuris suis]KFD71646.1 hypothetical protein M514_05358 [Trichuris suis]